MGFKTERIAAGKTVADVAEKFGITEGAVYQWETGRTLPKGTRLVELAKYFSTTIDKLLDAND